MANSIRKNILSLAHRMELDKLIRFSGQPDIFPFYHVVSDWHLPHIRHLYRYRRLQEFENDLEELLKWFEPVTFKDYLAHVSEKGGAGSRERRRGDKKRRMVLSFDDGLVECHQVIAPILKKKGVPAAFFLNNHFVDNHGLFYRYKASLIIDDILSDCRSLEKASDYLVIPKEQVVKAILMINPRQQAVLDELARKVEVDFVEYLREDPVYMSSQQVMEVVHWGFEIGGHSPGHADFSSLSPEEMIQQAKISVEDLQQRFALPSRLFSFPFTSQGVPESVIENLLGEGGMDVLLGTAGLKKTRNPAFIQRIPMEELEEPAMDVLKSEYLYYLLKKPFGKNNLRY